jgi:serine/threonine protein kinase
MSMHPITTRIHPPCVWFHEGTSMTCVACTGSSIPHTAFCGECGDRVGARAADPLLGKALDGRFLIESKIATGGFGSIYRARSLETQQMYAIKVLLAQHSSDPSVSARFRREAVTMASLANRHTVTTYELGEDRSGTRFIVMDLLHGQSLAERFAATGAMHWRTVLGIIRQVCDSLAEAHGLGIVHRDLKPANIFLCNQPVPDFVKVLDFGIAKILHGSNMHDGTELTRIGQAIGTLEYMSPEQLIGGELDNRTDIYTLGVVAYEMLTGRRPFGDVTGATGLVTALMTRRPPPPSSFSRGPLPAALDGVLLRCLERDATDRYADVRELAYAIDRMLDETKADLNTTQRQWGNRGSAVAITPVFHDVDDDEVTWIDAKSPFDSKPPIDEPRPASGPRAAVVEMPVSEALDPRVEAAVRSQLVEPPRMWRAQGTGVAFDVSDEPMHAFEPTGARPLYANQWAVGTEATADAMPQPRFPAGSSPVIHERPEGGGTVVVEPEVMAPPAPARVSFLKLALWVTGLTATGLGIGVAIASLAG